MKRERNETLAVMLDKNEKKTVQERADQLGLSMSMYVRMLIIKDVNPEKNK